MTESATAPRSLAVPLAAFAAGAAVAVVLGVFGRVHDPTIDGTTTLGYDTVLEMKVVVTAVIGVLVVLQLIGALWMYGKLGVRRRPGSARAHRASGTLAFLLAVFVGYHCLWALGLEYGELHTGEPVPTARGRARRTRLRGVRRVRREGGRGAVPSRARAGSCRSPGGLLFTAFVVIIWTSTVWYVGEEGWPSVEAATR